MVPRHDTVNLQAVPGSLWRSPFCRAPVVRGVSWSPSVAWGGRMVTAALTTPSYALGSVALSLLLCASVFLPAVLYLGAKWSPMSLGRRAPISGRV
jgi:hypothetical protein